jgi:hypothetical protein
MKATITLSDGTKIEVTGVTSIQHVETVAWMLAVKHSVRKRRNLHVKTVEAMLPTGKHSKTYDLNGLKGLQTVETI